MIYSKFGTALVLVSKTESTGGRVMIQATAVGNPDVHEYDVIGLKADNGVTEINAAVAALPPKSFENKHPKGRKRL